ncbi:MAG: aminopeptidase [Ruminococcus sp.]|nr:aminopeptidase [Ruminococcus sp.]
MAKKEKQSETAKLKEKLLIQKKNAVIKLSDEEIAECDKFCEGYKDFMDKSKIEREAVEYSVNLLKENGFTEYKKGMKLKAGSKIYVNNRGKAVIMAVIGTAPIDEGVRLCAAHIDSPRLDLKQNPLYEDNDLAYFKTHYYGGIKKYQWTTIPLALHGVIIKADGTSVTVNIGENDDDPVFCITDLLPHLAANQMTKTLAKGVTGEQLNLLIGSRPFKDDDESGTVKLNIMNILNQKYGITESDFISAELEAVPAFKARDIGFDRSMIGAYGHDDKVCAYPALVALAECRKPVHTAVTVLTDKEETGSDGNTGLCSAYLRYFIADIAEALGSDERTVLSASQCLSADVNAAFDPNFPEVNEKNNCTYINNGVCLTKYTGARGKSGTSDASAEYVGRIRRLMDSNNVIWQTGELGKVDEGGGGTVAAYIANLNVDTIDLGVPVLSMHAPYEIVSKIDTYMAYKAFKVFIED